MIILRTTVVLCLCAAAVLNAASAEKTAKMREAERAALTQYLENVRDSVQLLTTQYYAAKQQHVDQRDTDKEELDKLREQQERMNAEMARLREESLSREQTLAEEQKNLQQKREELKGVSAAVVELYRKESDAVMEAFPLDRENRRRLLEEVRPAGLEHSDPLMALSGLVKFKLRSGAQGDSLTISRQDVYPDNGAPRPMRTARFGGIFAYCMDTSGVFYVIRQTGRLGAAKFAVEPVTSKELSTFLVQTFPQWLTAGRPAGEVMFDVMQNDQSRQLVSGHRESTWTSLYHSLEKGGAVMIPMFLLALWAIVIGVAKVVQLFTRGRQFSRQCGDAVKLFAKKDFDGALAQARASKGVVARIIQTSVEHRSEERHIAERWVRDVIMQELPILGRSINTVAVIAGAAPLLGLLGTISGMITLFAAVTNHGTGDPKFLAGGISEALITAKTGLAIAIPALFLHDLLRNAKDRLVADLERHSIMIMNHVWPRE